MIFLVNTDIVKREFHEAETFTDLIAIQQLQMHFGVGFVVHKAGVSIMHCSTKALLGILRDRLRSESSKVTYAIKSSRANTVLPTEDLKSGRLMNQLEVDRHSGLQSQYPRYCMPASSGELISISLWEDRIDIYQSRVSKLVKPLLSQNGMIPIPRRAIRLLKRSTATRNIRRRCTNRGPRCMTDYRPPTRTGIISRDRQSSDARTRQRDRG
jgi:hypothetical protein